MARYKITYSHPGGSGTVTIAAQGEHEAVAKFNRDYTQGNLKKTIVKVEKLSD